jgi:hypothetical protein
VGVGLISESSFGLSFCPFSSGLIWTQQTRPKTVCPCFLIGVLPKY